MNGGSPTNPKYSVAHRIAMLACLGLALVGSVHADEDALPIVRKAFEAAKANETIARSYVFQERLEERRFTRKGNEKRRKSWTYDVTLLDHSEYRRLIAIDDEPLPPKTETKERRKLRRRIEKMRRESPRQREKRLARARESREEGERFLEEITKAFDFRLTGEEVVDGIPAYVVTAEPIEGYEPHSAETKALTAVRATLWISKDDHAWVKADIETIDDITWALVLKLRKGARMRFTQRKINDEVWMIDRWHARARARAALFVRFDREMTATYHDHRKFTADSTAVFGTVPE